ncbi:response regulator [Chromatocurvus halotolerans]|uniref:Response regulator receiver domain-containing protein n=1 Tax=Chromatocurvus halotolerans TaxID=1132028 RepID=A0A4R2LGU7_9GAMM|nr:response regulator [Chromatocurvus halotolerans]TCO78545.1 response regulator receiver domain-containing protein [Chromatocurvus halotolerans]
MKSPCILLVEDNELGRDMLSRRLDRAGFDVVTAADGEQALQIMRERQPALVLMDMSLPVMDGWTACRSARADPRMRQIPIIALTAHAMANNRQSALAAGCDDFATKPVDFPQLLAKIRTYIPT